MKAKKENKVYEVDKATKDRYTKAGYDIYDDEGKLIENAKNKTVSYEEYEKVKKELEKASKTPNNAKALKEQRDKLEGEKIGLQSELETAKSKIAELEKTIQELTTPQE